MNSSRNSAQPSVLNLGVHGLRHVAPKQFCSNLSREVRFPHSNSAACTQRRSNNPDFNLLLTNPEEKNTRTHTPCTQQRALSHAPAAFTLHSISGLQVVLSAAKTELLGWMHVQQQLFLLIASASLLKLDIYVICTSPAVASLASSASASSSAATACIISSVIICQIHKHKQE